MRSLKKDTSTTVLPSVSCPNQGLSNLSSVEPIPVPVEIVDISLNPIKDFNGFRIFPSIETFECSYTQLTSFNHFPEQNGVKAFNCKKTPLSGYPSLNIMCVIVFGDSLVSVNGVNINARSKKIGMKLASQLRPLLVTGWIIQNFDPIRIVNTITRKRKTIFVNDNPPKSPKKHEKEEPNSEDVYPDEIVDKDEKNDVNDSKDNENKNNNNSDNNNNNYDKNEESEEIDENIETNETNETKDIKEKTIENDKMNEKVINGEEKREKKEHETEEKNDNYLRDRFNKLQEKILLEIKKPDIIPPVLKSGRTSSLSATQQQSRPTSSLRITLKNSNDKISSPQKRDLPQ